MTLSTNEYLTVDSIARHATLLKLNLLIVKPEKLVRPGDITPEKRRPHLPRGGSVGEQLGRWT